MSITYTIALIDDMLAATAPDGDTSLMQGRLEDTLSQMSPDERQDALERITYESGLTLLRTREDLYAAEEAGADIIYTGTDMGWLEDAAGEMAYEAAARMPAHA